MTKGAHIIKNMSNKDYHSLQGLSATGINLLLDCPLKYKVKYIDGISKKEKHFMRGSLLHTMLLEPEEFEKRFFVMPENTRKTKSTLETFKVDSTTEIVSNKEFIEAHNQTESIKSHPLFKKIMNKAPKIEHSILFNDEELNVTFKTRPDIFTEDTIIDIKTTKSVNPFDFSRAIYEYGYHRQACLAMDGLEAYYGRRYNNFILLAVEKEYPYCVEAYVLARDDGTFKRYDAIAHAKRDIKKAARIYNECIASGIWPSYNSDKLVEINIPFWAQEAA